MSRTSLTELLEKYDVPVPRYTSYPAVPNWQETPAPNVWIDALQAVAGFGFLVVGDLRAPAVLRDAVHVLRL